MHATLARSARIRCRPQNHIVVPQGRFGPLYRRIFFTIDYEGLYDEPYVNAVGEIARCQAPITFQCPINNSSIGF